MQILSKLPRWVLTAMDASRVRAQVLLAVLIALPWCVDLPLHWGIDSRRMLALTTLFISIRGAWFVGLLVQTCGRRRMRQLFRCRGARPAIRMLRHRDRTVDPVTKQAWHEQLSRRLGIRLPTANDEQVDPATADAMYERAVNHYERQTLDRITSPALWRQSIESEFLINGWALRWIGLSSAASAVVWTCIDRGSIGIGLRPWFATTAPVSLNVESATIVLVSASVALIWLFFTPARARSAAKSYDLHLLESVTMNAAPVCARPVKRRNNTRSRINEIDEELL